MKAAGSKSDFQHVGTVRRNKNKLSKGPSKPSGADASKKNFKSKMPSSSNAHIDSSSSSMGSRNLVYKTDHSIQNVSISDTKNKQDQSIASRVYNFLFPKRDSVPKSMRLRLKTATLKLTLAHLSKIRETFDAIDVDRSGTVDTKELLDVLGERLSPYTNELFLSIVGKKTLSRITYEEYLLLVSTYCMFKKGDILRFSFDCFDTDKSGTITANEYKSLCDVINNSEPDFPGNYISALEMFDTNRDGVIDFNEFALMERKFPMILFPAFRLQDSMQKYTLGETAWIQIIEMAALEDKKSQYLEEHGGNGGHKFDSWGGWLWSLVSFSDRAVQHVVYLREKPDKGENEADWDGGGVQRAGSAVGPEQPRHKHQLSREKEPAAGPTQLPHAQRSSGDLLHPDTKKETANNSHQAARKMLEAEEDDADTGHHRLKRPQTTGSPGNGRHAGSGGTRQIASEIEHDGAGGHGAHTHHQSQSHVASQSSLNHNHPEEAGKRKSKGHHAHKGDHPPTIKHSHSRGEPRSNSNSQVDEDDDGPEGIATTHKSRLDRPSPARTSHSRGETRSKSNSQVDEDDEEFEGGIAAAGATRKVRRNSHVKASTAAAISSSSSSTGNTLTQASLQAHNNLHSKGHSDSQLPPTVPQSHGKQHKTTLMVCEFDD